MEALYSVNATPSSTLWIAAFDGKRFRVNWRELLRHPSDVVRVWRAWRST